MQTNSLEVLHANGITLRNVYVKSQFCALVKTLKFYVADFCYNTKSCRKAIFYLIFFNFFSFRFFYIKSYPFILYKYYIFYVFLIS